MGSGKWGRLSVRIVMSPGNVPTKTLALHEYARKHERLFVSRSEYPSGFPRHGHDFVEIVYVHRGSSIHECDGVYKEVSRGDILLVSRLVGHCFLDPSPYFQITTCAIARDFSGTPFLEESSAIRLWVTLAKSPYRRFPAGNRASGAVHLTSPQLEPFFEEIHREYQEQAIGWITVVQSLLSVIRVPLGG